VKLLIDRGNHFFETGDLISARILFTRAANVGDAAAAVAIGATYDPVVLANRGVRGVAPDLEKARSWYERAKEMGSPEGRRRLEMLAKRQHAVGPLECPRCGRRR
jgi:TPR repeat protein